MLFRSGIPCDTRKAVECFAKAAERGYPLALTNMGKICEAGFGTERNRARAYAWYRLAAESGQEQAAQLLDELRRGMEPRELTQGEEIFRQMRLRVHKES